MNRRKAIGKAMAKEEFIGEVADAKPEEKEKKMDVMKGKNKIEVNPKLGEGMEMKKDKKDEDVDAMKDMKKTEDPRSIPTMVNLVKNKMRAKGLNMSHQPKGKMVEGYKGTANLSKSHPEAVKKVEKNIEKGLGEKVPGGKMGVKKEDVNPFVQSSLEALGSIVKKKSNLGEEGYDHLRDRGMVRPSKDKKDGTSYPPSEEMKKTQKVNKGPSAAEIVKQKYGKAVMNMGKK